VNRFTRFGRIGPLCEASSDRRLSGAPAPSVIRAETKDGWIALGTRIDGAFGPFIPVGIRIGLDAKEKLHADPRCPTVIYYNRTKPPCPSIADGVMIATQASPRRGALQTAPERAPDGLMAVIVIKNRETDLGLRYSISDDWLPKIEPRAFNVNPRFGWKP